MSGTGHVPIGWASAPLGDLGEWYGGGTPSKFERRFWTDGTISWVSPKDMKSFLICGSEDRITQTALDETNVRQFPRGTVLMVIRSGILSRTFPVSVSDIAATMNQDLKGVRPGSGIDPRFVAYELIGREREVLRECSKQGTTVASIDTDKLHDFSIRLAPGPEQCRIVAKIEELFSDLDAGVAALERVKANLKRYRAAVLKAAVEGRLTEKWRNRNPSAEPATELLGRILSERCTDWRRSGSRGTYVPPSLPDVSTLHGLPSGWCWTTIEVAGEILLGRQRAPQFLTGRHPHPYLRVANVKDDHLDLTDVKAMDFDVAHFTKYRLLPGDILVSEGQSPDRVGESAVYRGGINGLCFQKTLHRFRANASFVSTDYAQVVFRAHVRSGAFRRVASITTNIAHLTLEKLRVVPFPLPPLAEQIEIAGEVDRRLSVTDAAETQIEHTLQRATRLRQSILKRALEGRLVPQDPSDEPADLLLRRLRDGPVPLRPTSGKARSPRMKRESRQRDGSR